MKSHFAASIVCVLAAGSAAEVACGATAVSSLKVDIGPVQAERAGRTINAKELAEIKTIDTFVVSPNGKFIAYAVRSADAGKNAISINWYVQAIEGKAQAYPAAGGGAPVFENPAGVPNGRFVAPSALWSRDSGTLFFLRKGADGVQVWSVSREGGGATELTHNDADVQRLAISQDRHKLFFAVGRSRAAMQASDEADGANGFFYNDIDEFEPLGNIESKVPAAPAWLTCNGSSGHADMVNPKRICFPTVWIKDLAGGAERLASADQQAEFKALDYSDSASVASGDFTASPKFNGEHGEILALPPIDGPLGEGPIAVRSVAIEDANGKVLKKCTDKLCQSQFVDLHGWNAATGEVVFSTVEGPGRQSISAGSQDAIYGWSPRRNRVRLIVRDEAILRPEFHGDSTCQLAQAEIVCKRIGWTQPDQLVAIELSSGRQRVIADPNPEFAQYATTRVEKLVWHDPQGDEVFGHLLFPANYQPGRIYPLVLTGYQARGFLWENYIEEFPAGLFAQDGMFVLAFDIPYDWSRMARQSDSVTRNSGWLNDFKSGRQFSAIDVIVTWMKQQQLVDPARMGITGLSTGASLVDQALLSPQGFAAASAGYSNTAALSYYLMPAAGREMERRSYGGGLTAGGLKEWQRTSPGLNAERVTTALSIDVADSEFYSAIGNFADLKDAGRPVEMHIYPNEYHIKWQPVHHWTLYRRNQQWFNFWLKGEEAPDPIEPDQYTRWRALREQREQILRAKATPWAGKMFAPDNRALGGTFLEIGAVNLFDRLPQYSNYSFSLLGYDPAQADIRGRFPYIRLGANLK